MRNFTESSVSVTKVFKGSYSNALAWARNEQGKVKEDEAVAFTIDGDENGEGEVSRHEGHFGGQPPYQPIIHAKEAVSSRN